LPLHNRKYPHLLKEDIVTWERYLALRGSFYNSIDYDVRVGSGQKPASHHSPNYKKMISDLTKKRIDALGHTQDQIHIIEICQRASMKTVGQAVAYPHLFKQTYPTTKQIKMIIVCERIDTDLFFVFHHLNVEVILV